MATIKRRTLFGVALGGALAGLAGRLRSSEPVLAEGVEVEVVVEHDIRLDPELTAISMQYAPFAVEFVGDESSWPE